jgi:NADH-quinone oxidoreductase subunit L
MPLIVLAIMSVIGGYVGLPAVISEHHTLNTYLGSVVSNFNVHHLEHNTEWMLIGLSTGLVIVMIIVARVATKTPNFVENTGIAKVLENKWYVDELYDAVIVRPLAALSDALDRFVEKLGIDGIVNGIGRLVRWSSDRVRLLQTGQVGFYIFVMVIGMALLFAIRFFGLNY